MSHTLNLRYRYFFFFFIMYNNTVFVTNNTERRIDMEIKKITNKLDLSVAAQDKCPCGNTRWFASCSTDCKKDAYDERKWERADFKTWKKTPLGFCYQITIHHDAEASCASACLF